VCFGGDAQFVQIVSAASVSAEGAAAISAGVPATAGAAASGLVTSGVGRAIDMRWHADRPGADMRFMDDNHSVTRVNSDGWGIQLAAPRLTSGIVRVVLEIVQNSGSYLFIGVASSAADVFGGSASLRQVNTVCMQADGDLYVNGDSTAREHDRMVLASGSWLSWWWTCSPARCTCPEMGGPASGCTRCQTMLLLPCALVAASRRCASCPRSKWTA